MNVLGVMFACGYSVVRVANFLEKLAHFLAFVVKVGEEEKCEDLSSCVLIIHITAKQIISRHRKDKNSSKMYKYENCTCKAVFS